MISGKPMTSWNVQAKADAKKRVNKDWRQDREFLLEESSEWKKFCHYENPQWW
jgi:hypothetical protein